MSRIALPGGAPINPDRLYVIWHEPTASVGPVWPGLGAVLAAVGIWYAVEFRTPHELGQWLVANARLLPEAIDVR